MVIEGNFMQVIKFHAVLFFGALSICFGINAMMEDDAFGIEMIRPDESYKVIWNTESRNSINSQQKKREQLSTNIEQFQKTTNHAMPVNIIPAQNDDSMVKIQEKKYNQSTQELKGKSLKQWFDEQSRGKKVMIVGGTVGGAMVVIWAGIAIYIKLTGNN
jgi:hypothetical protein